MNNRGKRPNLMGWILPWLIATLAILSMWGGMLNTANPKTLTYDEFVKMLDDNAVSMESVSISPQGAIVNLEIEAQVSGIASKYRVRLPRTEEIVNDLVKTLSEENVETKIVDPTQTNILMDIAIQLLPYAVVLGFGFWLLRKSVGGGSKGLDFGKSKAKIDVSAKKVKFDDVAGTIEEKEELVEVVDYLKNPKRFAKMGAKIPRGILLVGPPGTGKTLLAKAVAGEANVPFYSISGSDFVEMYVGVGASRVRDMFKKAKQTAPCIIFIDEIDAVGRQRGAGVGGGHDEREQTLNQILVEMDGFADNDGVMILAATNREDILDSALLRPGRFDRKILVSTPDREGRIEILKVHARNKKIAEDISFENIAKRTPGFSGAELANVLNEAAIMAVRRNKEVIDIDDIDEAIDRVIGGPAKKSKIVTPKERNIIAYHEAGHAMVGLDLKDADTVQKVTIIPRGAAGGYVLMTPEDDRFLLTKNQLLAKITGLLAGRVSEEIFFGEVSTGAHNDIDRATKIARTMVTEYGMSSLGPIHYDSAKDGVFLGRDYNSNKSISGEIAYEIDKAVRDIINKCKQDAQDILVRRRDLVKLIAETLLDKETLTNEEIMELFKDKEGTSDLLNNKKADNQENVVVESDLIE